MMDELIHLINNYPNGTKLIIELNDGIRIKGEIDTIYETDNRLEPDEDGYKEFYACVIKIQALLNHQDSKEFKIGSLIEISNQEPPNCIWLEDNTQVWNLRK